jgi:hypothetical protein
MSQSGSRILDPVIKGVEPTFQRESGSDSFDAKVALSLNEGDLSFRNSVAGSYLISQVA